MNQSSPPGTEYPFDDRRLILAAPIWDGGRQTTVNAAQVTAVVGGGLSLFRHARAANISVSFTMKTMSPCLDAPGVKITQCDILVWLLAVQPPTKLEVNECNLSDHFVRFHTISAALAIRSPARSAKVIFL